MPSRSTGTGNKGGKKTGSAARSGGISRKAPASSRMGRDANKGEGLFLSYDYMSEKERNEMSIICFDTETTGFADDDEVIQLSIADAVTGQELLNRYYRPSDALMQRRWDDASAVTGIYPEDVESCPSITDPDSVREIMEVLSPAELLVGYHVFYDAQMMSRHGFDMSRYVYQDPMYSFAAWYWSTHPGEKHVKKNGKEIEPWLKWKANGFGGKGGWVNKNLSDAARIACGITDFGAHDSMNDVYATIEVWKAMNSLQEDVYFRGFAYDGAGEPICDRNGEPVYRDALGNPMIDPNGNGFVYVYDYTLDQLEALD